MIKQTSNKAWIILLLILQLLPKIANAEEGFFDQGNQYKGFYWFEQEENVDTNEEGQKITPTFESLSADEAMNNIQERKVKLSEARAVMLELSFQGASREEVYKAVRNYKRLENQMRNSGGELASAWEMVNFTNPEFVDRINNPVNVPANRVKRMHEKKLKQVKIREFAKKFDLVLFEQDGCPYCREFKPIMKHFVNSYGFSLDIVGDKPEHLNLIKKLSIEAAPTVIAVSKDGKESFELSRGLVTISGLENHVILATELLQDNYQLTREEYK